ncbi:G5 domain-containing protein [Streptococcus pseudopneumoniae]|uniref:G5 domain-containing protein n=2 Tax=Streptococcus pseudopneumoniae TaxID=257758 RepID=UPI001C660701|nr:G5 domain-containing protein [Streptococcus pseudopneumoniae]MBW8115679.1 G5 domain-containing protein [Streptococcus pseudopneumoniae]
MKKWKQRCSVILGLAVLGFANLVEVVTPFVEPTSVYAQENSNVNGNTLTFTAKSREEIIHTTEKKIKPMDLLVVLDFSSSNTNNITKIFSDLKSLASTLTDKDQIWLFSYYINSSNSYTADRYEITSGKPLSKTVLIRLLEEASSISSLKDLLKKNGFNVNDDSFGKGFSEIYNEYTGKKNSYVSTIQFTDEWQDDEEIDVQYANWAKNHAKTFYTVTYNANEGSHSVEAMKAAGHNNIFISDASTNELERQKAINAQFAKTAVEEIKEEKVSVKQKGTVSISPEADLTLTSAELVSPNGQKTPLTITNNTVSWSGDLDNGSYTVHYTFTGTPSVERSIRSSVTVDGKKVDEKINTLRPEKIAFETKYEEDPSLAAGQEKEKQAGSEGSQLVSLKDGKVISTTITKPKVDRIVLRGTKGSDVEVKTEDIPFNKTYTEDPELEIGQTKVVTEGAVGQKEITKTYVTQSGKRVGEPAVTEKILKKAVDKVIAKGTKGQDVDVAESDIAFKTVYTEDPELEFGQEKIVTEGVLGVKRTTKTYVTQKGVRTKDEPSIKEEVLKEAVDKVVARGSKSAVATKELDYKTTYVEDKDSEAGKKTVVTKGSKGHETSTVTYSFNSETGEVTANEPKVEKTESVAEVISVGTKSVVTTKDLDYKTTYVEDKESEAGKKTVVTKGSKGHETTTITYSFNSETGEVTANEPKVEKTESVDEVISVGTKPVVTTKDLDYKTKYVEDKESEAGKKTVVTKGRKGHERTTVTYSFNSETGEVTANEPKVEKTESVAEVISVGTKPKVEIMETEFKTEKRENKDLKKGEEKIIQAGVKGRETITTTYYLDPDTGEVKENKPTLEKVDPVNEIIEVGTQAEKVLPNTGTSLSNFLTLTGMIGIVLGISVIIYRKLNKK